MLDRVSKELLSLLNKDEQEELLQHLASVTADEGWPSVYVNRDTRKMYTSHHEKERMAVYSDTPRYVLFRGGEGGGKSCAGIVKTLNRLRRGMNGCMVSPDLVHLQKSLWPEFQRWCPWQCVVEKQRYRQAVTWEPSKPFSLVFNNTVGTQSVLLCGGAKESEVGAWEGPNLSFVHMDEFRRHKTAAALKVFDGRVRIPGPKGEPPQIFITTTPRKHWLYEYFGPLQEDDPKEAFKEHSLDVVLLTVDNELNLQEGFARRRAQTLTAAEARVLLMAEWEDVEAGQRFLPSMMWWDACKEDLPELTPYEPMVLGIDAAEINDCFAIIGVTRHPDDYDKIAVRFVQVWEPKGKLLDYMGTEDEPGPEMVIRNLADRYSVVCAVYDPYQMHDMAMRLQKDGVTWLKRFGQSGLRNEADQQLLSLITQRRLAHDGNAVLRKHIDNADRKRNEEGKLRIVKREESMKVDLAVALSMSAFQCLRLRI